MTDRDKVVELVEEVQSTLTEDIQALEEALAHVDAAARGEYTLAEVAGMLDKAMTASARVKTVVGILEKIVERERYREEFVALPNNGVLEMGYNAGGKKWEHSRVKRDVIAAIVERHTNEDGDIDIPVEQLVEEAFDTAGISYWKTTELDRLQLDPNSYSIKKPSKFKAKVHRD